MPQHTSAGVQPSTQCVLKQIGALNHIQMVFLDLMQQLVTYLGYTIQNLASSSRPTNCSTSPRVQVRACVRQGLSALSQVPYKYEKFWYRQWFYEVIGTKIFVQKGTT
jgi:hypothetical protein